MIRSAPRLRRALLNLERLEDRLAPANLHITGASFVDANANPQAAPVYGQMVYVLATWTTSGLAGGEAYVVRYTVDGVPADSGGLTGQAGNGLSYGWYRGGWYAGPGTHSIVVKIDGSDAISESDETDNTLSFNITSVAPTDLPNKFVQPITGLPNRDWNINNYADVDPRGGFERDYRGGNFEYDGHDAIDAGPWGFWKQDAGLPIVTVADGVVSQVLDGNYDRETSGGNRPGNFVRVDHGNNWQTLYYHFAKDSIVVRPGDAVKAGQMLGLMGSAGSSTGTHLHYTAFYRGSQVEAGYSPSDYWINPLPYAGDVVANVIGQGVTNYDPGPDFYEDNSLVRDYGATTGGAANFWFKAYNFGTANSATTRWYRPSGALAYTNQFSPGGNYRFSYWYWTRNTSDFTATPGLWQVAQVIDGVEQSRITFNVTAGSGASAMQVKDSTGRPVLDKRTTPILFGSVALGGAAPTQTFTIRNHGYQALALANLSLPPGFSLSGTLPSSIAVNASATVPVRLDTARAGEKFGAVRFDTNDPDSPNYSFNVSGTVTGAAPGGAPVLTLIDKPLAYYTGALPRLLAPTGTLTDSNSANFNGGNFTAEIAGGGDANDRLAVFNQGSAAGQIGVSGSTVTYGGVAIGTFNGGSGATPLVVTLNASATPTAGQALLRNISYQYVGPTTTRRRYVRFSVTDDTATVSNQPIAHVIHAGFARNPTVAPITNTAITRGAALTRGGSFADPFGFAWSATVDYGDGTGVQPLTLNGDHTFTLAHTYTAAPGNYTTTVTVANDLGGYDVETFVVAVGAPIQVTSVQVNDGSLQRSAVRSLVVNFSRAVTTDDAGAFAIVATGGGGLVPTISVAWNGARTSATLTFSGASVFGASIADGRYRLDLDATKLHDDTGGVLDGDSNGQSGGAYAGFAFFRLFGDQDGDADNDTIDLGRFRQAFGSATADANYRSYFDYDLDGDIDTIDLGRFRQRFGVTLP